MYQTLMSSFETKCAALQSENCRLRELLADVQQELVDLTSAGGHGSPRKTNKGMLDFM